MVSSNPPIEGFSYSSVTAKDGTDGSFSLTIKCFEGVQTTVTLSIVVPTYNPVQFTTPDFTCVAPKVAQL